MKELHNLGRICMKTKIILTTLVLASMLIMPLFASEVIKTREPDLFDRNKSIMYRERPITIRELYWSNHPDSFAHRSIPNQLMFSSVRIETNLCTGTGFVFNFEPEGVPSNTYFPCLVTNKHIIINEKGEKAYGGKFTFHKKAKDKDEPCLNGELIPTQCSENFGEKWIFHPDDNIDLCILPLNFFNEENQPFYIGIDKADVPTDKQLKELFAAEEILMVGYPNGLWDEANNFPILRKGSTATHPAFDLNNKPEFLIDIASFHGSSGSPVLVYNKHSYQEGNTVYSGRDRLLFMGIMSKGPAISYSGNVTSQDISHNMMSDTNIPMHLGYVIKTKVLLELESLLIKGTHFW